MRSRGFSAARLRGPSLTGAALREDGYVIVIVMVLIMVGLLAGGAAISETLNTRHSADRQQRSARALQAADAGVETELYRANQLNFSNLNLTSGASLSSIITQLATCPVPQVNSNGQVVGIQWTAVASVGSSCPTNSQSGTPNPLSDMESVGHHGYFQVQFIPGATAVGDFIQFNPKIVASGVDDNANPSDPSRYISRRVEAALATVAPWRTLEAENNLKIDVPPAVSALGLKLAGTTTFNGTAAADNTFTIQGQPALLNTFVAANAGGSGLTEPSVIDYCNPSTGYTHPNVNVTLTAGSINRVTSNCSSLVNRSAIQIAPSKQDCVPISGVESCSNDAGFGFAYTGASQDEIYNTDASKTISFGPGDYVFCGFQTNGPVSMSPTSTQAVRIFIDSQSSSRCSSFQNHSSTPTPPAHFTAGPGNFIATQGIGWNPVTGTLSTTKPSQAQIYVAGNGAADGTMVYSAGSTALSNQSMFVYAPMSNVTVATGQTCILGTCVVTGTLAGAVIGYDVEVSATAITQDLGLLNYPLSSTLGPFHVQKYVECQPQYPLPSPDPTSGC